MIVSADGDSLPRRVTTAVVAVPVAVFAVSRAAYRKRCPGSRRRRGGGERRMDTHHGPAASREVRVPAGRRGIGGAVLAGRTALARLAPGPERSFARMVVCRAGVGSPVRAWPRRGGTGRSHHARRRRMDDHRAGLGGARVRPRFRGGRPVASPVHPARRVDGGHRRLFRRAQVRRSQARRAHEPGQVRRRGSGRDGGGGDARYRRGTVAGTSRW